jgi:hypothetical protein
MHPITQPSGCAALGRLLAEDHLHAVVPYFRELRQTGCITLSPLIVLRIKQIVERRHDGFSVRSRQ